jgi:multidrug efflux system outer membrane protein
MKVRSIALVPAVLGLLAGCKVGPEYHRPSALGTNSMPAGFEGNATNNGVAWKPAEPAAQQSRGPWWRAFDDPELGRLEDLATSQNQSLAAAIARWEEARAQIDIARAGLFPQVAATPSYSRERTSANEEVNGQPAGVAHNFGTLTMAIQAGWEIDLWGRLRREAEAARARASASAGDLEALKLEVQSELAADYLILRATDEEYDLLVRTAEAYRRSLELTVNRRRGGIASDLDVSQAETQLRRTEAQLPPLLLQRAKLLHAIAVLCGKPATGFEVTNRGAELPSTPEIPPGVPSELLERRPDIATAEERMIAANAEIGVAQAAFYPRLTLNGLGGFQSVNAASWFDWPSRFWAVGPSVDLPLFTGGRNRAQLAFARASYQETVANYRQAVLTSFQEVEDRLAAQHLLKATMTAQVSALAAARHTLEIANNRYKAGLVTYLEVATAQALALSLEQSVVQLRGEKLVSTVGLIKALGGSW